jgi:phytoene desaturase
MSGKIIVIGSGPGGLAAAMLLAHRGYDVTVYEQQPYLGGRTSALQIGEFTFDRGPTFLNMPQVLEEIFQETERNVHDYLDLIHIDPMYRLVFDQVEFDAHRVREQMIAEIQRWFPGNEAGYDRFMQQEAIKLKALTPILQNKHDRLRDYFRPDVLRAIPHLSLGKSLYDCLSKYFSDERLKLAFTFQAKYLGMSPWECPGAFTILSYIEHAFGIYHPRGGVHQICSAMAKVVHEYGGKIHLGVGVKQVVTSGKNVTGVLLDNGEIVNADEVVINTDFAYAMSHLFSPQAVPKYSTPKLARKRFSCSTFMLYLCVNRTYDLPHHSILFSGNYKENVDDITKRGVLSEDPSVYVQNPCVSDDTLAPPGCSAIYVLAPVANNRSKIDWDSEKLAFRDKILRIVEEKGKFTNLREHIIEERMITPIDWEAHHYIYEGATFNLAHDLQQMMYLRPHNRFDELENCWLVGGGTHPGSGLPTIMESARITARGIATQDRK